MGAYFGAIELKDLITAREYMKLEDIISTSYPYVYADEKFGLYGRADRLQRGFYPSTRSEP